MITAPLGIGRRLIAPGIPEFHDRYPDIEVRLRLSDHHVDILAEGVDIASSSAYSRIRTCACAHHELATGRALRVAALFRKGRASLRAPGRPPKPQPRLSSAALSRSKEYYWTLQAPDGVRKSRSRSYDSDDGDVLTSGRLRTRHRQQAALRGETAYDEGCSSVLGGGRPRSAPSSAAIYPHKRVPGSEVRLMIDFMARALVSG